VQPGTAEGAAPGGILPVTAPATYDKAPLRQDNLSAQWSSSDKTVAIVDPNTGVVNRVSVGGPITITSSWGGKQSNAQVSCLSSAPAGPGNCTHLCGNTRCGALTGYCSSNEGGACHQIYDPAHCPVGQPTDGTATNTFEWSKRYTKGTRGSGATNLAQEM
jgi:hypothetical protein